MKKGLLLTLVVVAAALFAFSPEAGENYKTLEAGDKAPMITVTMKSIDGKRLNLESLAEENGTLVVFTCNYHTNCYLRIGT